MLKPWRWLSISVAGFLAGISMGALSTTLNSSVSAQTQSANYPDVESDYWAQPYIQALTSRGILTGYPDNTYRPENIIDRDEFAAVLRQAFNPETERSIASGSVFTDVPQGYWASQPIEEAYETGFMQDFSPDSQRLFRPKNEVSRLEALLALYRGLELEYEAPQPQAKVETIRPVMPNQLAFPMAFTSLIPSFLVAQPVQATAAQPSPLSAQEYVQQYYDDTEQIPEDAMDAIAALTQNNVIVNYPNPQQLDLQEPLQRGTTAALIYQTLAAQGKVDPMALEGETPDVVAEE